eukprot:m.11397 g.11397  ORF g.11397 m.11397 type:complete len:641 (+) comp5782_c0_seq1:1-1923(+)
MKEKSAKQKNHRFRPAHVAHEIPEDLQEQEISIPLTSAGPDGEGSSSKSIFEQLLSTDPSEREFGCSGISNALLDAGNLPEMLKHGVPRTLLRLFADPARAVRVEASCALRNLCLTGGEAISKGLIEGDVFTPLSAFLTEMTHDAPRSLAVLAVDSTPLAERIEHEQTIVGLDQALHLLWELSETCETAIALLNSNNLLPLVFTCLRPDFPAHIAVVAAQCLLTLSEDNPAAIHLARTTPDVVGHMATLLTTAPSPIIRACIAGVLFNIRECVPADAMPAAVQALGAAISGETQDEFALISANLHEAFAAGDATQPSPFKARVSDLTAVLVAQRTALEILANMSSSTDEADGAGWEDMDAEGDDDDAPVPEPEAAAEAGPAGNAMVTLILQAGLPTAIFQRLTSLPRGVEQLFSGNPKALPLLQQRAAVQLRAVACVGNILDAISPAALGPAELNGLWNALFGLCANVPAGADADFMQIVVSTLWTLARRCCQTPETKALLTPPLECVQPIAETVARHEQEQVRCTAVGLLGCLGQLPHLAPTLNIIGQACLHAVTADPSLWVLAEGLNSIFDVFAEPDVNTVFVALEFLQRLQALLPVAKAKAKEARRQRLDRNLVGRLDDAKVNLKRFIDYKRAQGLS